MIQILWIYIEPVWVILFRQPDGRVQSSGLTQNLMRKIDRFEDLGSSLLHIFSALILVQIYPEYFQGLTYSSYLRISWLFNRTK